MKWFFYLLILMLGLSQCRPKEESIITMFPGKPEVPASIQKEHDDLLAKMYQITLLQDSTGKAATKLYELMQHHFKEEEDYVLPPLGLLPLLAEGKVPDQTKEIIQLTDKLKAQLTHITVEHQLIKAFMDELMQVASKQNHPEIMEFEKELHKHATIEEEVYFPAAIMVGEYLKLKVVPE
jgi:hypothetical protein